MRETYRSKMLYRRSRFDPFTDRLHTKTTIFRLNKHGDTYLSAREAKRPQFDPLTDRPTLKLVYLGRIITVKNLPVTYARPRFDPLANRPPTLKLVYILMPNKHGDRKTYPSNMLKYRGLTP